MDNKNAIVKDDINFLEYPNWVVDERNDLKEFTLKKENGTYEITGFHGLPNRFDKIVLYFLLYKLLDMTQLNSIEMITTRYEIAKNVFYNTKSLGKTEYKRIMFSLKKWKSVDIKFNGIFYEGDNYTMRLFSVIDDVILDKEKRQLYVRFNQQYIKQLKESKFYKFIKFDEYKILTRPLSAMLYEIFIKSFKGRQIWKIGILKLAEKLTLTKKYPSQILEKLKPAINEINRKTELNIKFKYNKDLRICTFIKVHSPQKTSNQNKASKQNTEILDKLLKLLPAELNKQRSVKECLSSYIQEKDYDYVRSNIAYAVENADTNLKVYLKKSLENDWGEEYRAKEKARIEREMLKRKQEEEARREEEKQERKLEQERLEYERQKQYINSLSEETLEKARKTIIEKNPDYNIPFWTKRFKDPTLPSVIHLFIEALN